jgi:hypothetical protein
VSAGGHDVRRAGVRKKGRGEGVMGNGPLFEIYFILFCAESRIASLFLFHFGPGMSLFHFHWAVLCFCV